VKVSVADVPAPVFCHSIPFGVFVLSIFYRQDADKSPFCLSGAAVALPEGIHEIPIDIYQESGKIQANSASYGMDACWGCISQNSIKLQGPQRAPFMTISMLFEVKMAPKTRVILLNG